MVLKVVCTVLSHSLIATQLLFLLFQQSDPISKRQTTIALLLLLGILMPPSYQDNLLYITVKLNSVSMMGKLTSV